MARDGIHGAGSVERTATFLPADEQQLPAGDRRHRVQPSAKFYIAQVICGDAGCTLNLSESAERVRHRQHGRTEVDFEGRRHALRPAAEIAEFLQRFARGGCIIYIGGMAWEPDTLLVPAPFIHIVSREDFKKLRRFHPAAM